MASSDHTTPVKTCTKCDIAYPATTEFYPPSKRGKFGVHSICRNCKRKHDLERWSNPEVQVRMKATRKKWGAANRERLNENERRFYKNNCERIRETERINSAARQKRYNAKHPEKNSQIRAVRRGAEGSHTNAEVALMLEAQKRCCWYCGTSIADYFEEDHRIPLSRGGTNDASNIVLTCLFCNRSKGNKLPHEWNGRLL